MVSLQAKSLFTNVPVEESIQLAVDLMKSSPEVPSFDRETFVGLMILTVSDVHFMCVGQCYVQIVGFAMGSSLAVILSNMWLKQFEPCIGGIVPESLESLDTGEFTDTAATPDVQESSESADTGAFTVTAAASDVRWPCVFCKKHSQIAVSRFVVASVCAGLTVLVRF